MSHLKGSLILVADDNEGAREVLRLFLALGGAKVLEAATGLEALEQLQRQRDAISAALLDVDMPEMDGPATLRALHRIAPEIPCCLMTAGSLVYTNQDLLNSGAQRILAKPFQFLELSEALEEMLSGKLTNARGQTAESCQKSAMPILRLDCEDGHC